MNEVEQCLDKAKAKILQKELDNMKILNKVEFAIETEGECFAIQIIEHPDGKHLNFFKRRFGSGENYQAVQARLVDDSAFFDNLNRKQNFGRKIKKMRIAAGIHKYEFVIKTKMSSLETLQRIENGEVTPKIFLLKDIADALNVSVDELLED